MTRSRDASARSWLDRRQFFRASAAALVTVVTRPAVSARAAAEPIGLLEIHRGTRNRRFGPVGAKLPRWGGPPARAKPYAGAPRTPLVASAAPGRSLAEALGEQSPAGFSGEALSAAGLARLLRLTNGVTGFYGDGASRRPLRAAPSAGALYAGEVYVVAERVNGLAPGLYYYAVEEDALVKLREGALLARVVQSVERPMALAGAAAAVLLSNVFERYTGRYANRGYRYALIDSGHIGENLGLAARASGLAERAFSRFHDEQLNALLEIDGVSEAVCALHAVGHPGRGAAAAGAAERQLAEAATLGVAPRGGSLPERYHQATKLVGAVGPAAPVAEGAVPQLPVAPSGSATRRLPAAAGSQAPLDHAIRIRRSTTTFVESPAPLEGLALVLDAALAPGHPPRAEQVELLFAVNRVEGLAPGLYRFDPSTRRVVELRAGSLALELVDACLGQQLAGRAAVVFLMVGRLEEAAERGARRYRDLLLEAGAIGQRIYLAAEAEGLSARNLAAFRDDQANSLLGLDGRTRALVHVTLFGRGD